MRAHTHIFVDVSSVLLKRRNYLTPFSSLLCLFPISFINIFVGPNSTNLIPFITM